ncbi:hypothetical protein PG996_012950 [Apiospora saccharicola]|uniref:Uncharacterized protein n=1 Tax=Apiospora saccharicola TaxID=335842 RepID=A0ABR1U445_9PEZI
MVKSFMVRPIEHSIYHFSTTQDASVGRHLVPTILRVIRTNLELIKVGLGPLTRRDPGTPVVPVARSSLDLTGEIQSSLSILLDFLENKPDDRDIPGLLIDIGASLGGLKGYLLELDELMEKTDEQHRADHDQKVSQYKLATEPITLQMSYRVKEAIDSLNALYEPESDQSHVPVAMALINRVLYEVEDGVNDLRDRGFDHRSAEYVLDTAELVRVELKLVPADLRWPDSKDPRVKSRVVSDLFKMIGNLLSLGQAIEEEGDAPVTGTQDDCDSAGGPCQCEHCIMEELDQAVDDLKLLTSNWAKAKENHVPHRDA